MAEDKAKTPVTPAVKDVSIDTKATTPAKDFAKNPNASAKAPEAVEVPVKGFNLPHFVDLTAIGDIYGSVRDGDLWSAFAKGIAFINGVINAPINPPTRVAAARMVSESEARDFERVCCQFDECIESLEGREDEVVEKPVRVGSTPTEAGKTDFSITDVLTILKIVQQLADTWRQRRKEQA